MTSLLASTARIAGLCALMLACAGREPARAQESALADSGAALEAAPVETATSAPAPVASARTPTLVATPVTGIDGDAFLLQRAVAEHSTGHLHGVIEHLERMDLADGSKPEADRAAFLLAQAYLQLGSADRFRALARHVATWPRESPLTRWIAWQLALFGARPGADATRALRTLVETAPRVDGSPLAATIEALDRAAAGNDDGALHALATLDTATALGRDLSGAARVRLAARALERGDDPSTLLTAVPAGSRYASRARHMLGITALERGDLATGVPILEALLADDSTYAARREVALALAGIALDQERWGDAWAAFGAIEASRQREYDDLTTLLGSDSLEALWGMWEEDARLSDALLIDSNPVGERARELARSAEDLRGTPSVPWPGLDVPARRASLRVSVPPPPDSVWGRVRDAAESRDQATAALERAWWAMTEEMERLEKQRRYLGTGRERAGREADSLLAYRAELDSVRASLAAIDRRLQAVRDEAKRRIAARTAELLASADGDRLWMRGMRVFHLDGPHREQPIPTPPGYPSPDSLLAAEDSLARSIQAFATALRDSAPGLIDRSYATAWRPQLIDRAGRLAGEAKGTLAWAQRLTASLDSSLAAAATSDTLEARQRRVAALETDMESRAAAYAKLRAQVASGAVRTAIDQLDAEREGIEYGLAAAAYGRSLALSRVAVDSASVTAGPIIASEGDDGTRDTLRTRFDPRAGDDPLDDPETTVQRAEAIHTVRAFLAAHPRSTARGEMRFRLADLLSIEARSMFRAQMAAYANGEAGGALPVLDVQPSLDLYRAILRDDSTFAHRDAVLFNAGMILADDGDPQAEDYFARLVRDHPDSRHVQEAQLRMGDMHFDAADFAACIPLYARAAEGGDPTLQAIALYKKGWAHYNLEQMADAADAFRAVLDVYGAQPTGTLRADIAPEAESYLVHALARAGGAPAFATYFDRIGKRPYEKRVLMALGQHFRRFSLFEDAIASDALALDRFPDDADALLIAGRMTDTHRRAEHGPEARAAQLAAAARFAPGGAWAKAQASDSVRAAGDAFARASYRSVAVHHHLEARRTGSEAEWREARTLYERVLELWPSDPESPAHHLFAGEASAKLEDYPSAVAHLDAAAAGGPDSIRSDARLQRVGVTDAWYEKSRVANGAKGLGSDSLAKDVLAAGDRLLAADPGHRAAADVAWRQGHLAFAHGWYERAATDFAGFATRHAGDARAGTAAGLTADAYFRLARYDAAGTAFEQVLVAAREAGNDSLARHAERAIPVCWYKHAESVVAADSMNFTRYAPLFEKVATNWPAYEHADLARYRAGLAWLAAGKSREGVAAMEGLIRDFPKSEFVRDAHLTIARTWETEKDPARAGEAYLAFATRYDADSSSGDATLKAADLFASAGDAPRAEALRLDYIRRHPGDYETAMAVLAPLAKRDLATVTAELPVSRLLPRPAPAKAAPKGSKTKAKPAATTAAAPDTAAARSHLAAYLKLCEAHPDLAERAVLAQVRFLQGEESAVAYRKARLTQPLEKSIPTRQKLLDQVVGHYTKSVEHGDPEWAHASAFRIGEALVAFGDALQNSERPADLQGDDLLAYQDVLGEQAQAFYDRAEGVWSDLLRKQGTDGPDDAWLARARESLWKRLGGRFYFKPEFAHPAIDAKEPAAVRTEDEKPKKGKTTAKKDQRTNTDVAHREGDRR